MSITNEWAARILDECPWDVTGGDDAECCIAADMGAKALRRASEVESELARLRRELAELRKPVEVLPVEVEAALDARERACFEHDEQGEWPLGWRADMPLHQSMRFADVRAAILTALNERGGGK